MTKKVVIYTRVSTLDQTIDNQLLGHCQTKILAIFIIV